MNAVRFRKVAESANDLTTVDEIQLLHNILGWLAADQKDDARTAAQLRDYIDERITELTHERR